MSSSLLDQLIEPNIGCLTVEAAERLVALRADPDLQRRVDELADRANHGTPTIEEQGEYHRYLAAFHLVTLMQAPHASAPECRVRPWWTPPHDVSFAKGRESLRALRSAPARRTLSVVSD